MNTNMGKEWPDTYIGPDRHFGNYKTRKEWYADGPTLFTWVIFRYIGGSGYERLDEEFRTLRDAKQHIAKLQDAQAAAEAWAAEQEALVAEQKTKLASKPWENEDGSTNVTGFLAAYEADSNTFWRADAGHIQNVLDELIDRLEES